jgi:UDP-glucose 4-epimerase
VQLSKGAPVVVTGAAGFLGRALVQEFSHRGCSIVAVDIATTDEVARGAAPHDSGASYVQGDVAAPEIVDQLRNVGPISGVVHAAGLTPEGGGRGPTGGEVTRVAVMGTLNMLRVAKEQGPGGRLLYISSTAVDPLVSLAENDKRSWDSSTPYATSKLACELMALELARVWHLDCRVIRPAGLYGEDEMSSLSRPLISPLSAAIRAAARGVRPVARQGDRGAQDWLYVADAANAIASLFFESNLSSQTYPLGSGTVVSWGEVLTQISLLRSEPFSSEVVVDSNGVAHQAANVQGLQQEAGWRQRTTLEAGLALCYEAILSTITDGGLSHDSTDRHLEPSTTVLPGARGEQGEE